MSPNKIIMNCLLFQNDLK